jgi:TonB family protein
LKNDPQARWEFLDVSTNQNTDEFHQDVREVMARCSEVPLSDRNKRAYRTADTVYAPIELSKPAQIKTKPAPLYDDQAKANSIQGTVVLLAVFASSGQVTDIEVLEGLPYGLTESCIVAAHRIRFEPAVKDNHPVSTLMRLEYHFSFDR